MQSKQNINHCEADMAPEEESTCPGFSRVNDPLSDGETFVDSGRWSQSGPVRTSGVSRVDAKSPMMKILTDAEAASHSAAIQLVSFKDALEDKFAGKRASAADRHQLTRQRGLLLERLEEFRRINKTVRQKLKQLQHAESCRVEADKQIDDLLKRITQAETENEHLKSNLSETERRIEELVDQRQEEQENMKTLVHKAQSVEATQSHLQTQVWNKEAENDRLTLQLQTLERTVAQQKKEVDRLNAVITTLNEKAEQDKEVLKKANRAQRLRAERFEAAIEKCSAQLKKKDVQLAGACSERDNRRRLKEQKTDEKQQVVAQISLLKREVAALTSRLQWEKDEMTAAKALVTQRVEKLAAENRKLNVENSTLKTCVSELEQQLNDCEAALIEEKIQSQERKRESEECRRQTTELEADLNNLSVKYSILLEDTSAVQDGKERRVDKVRRELQGRVEKLASLPERIGAVKQDLCECRQNLRCSQRKCSNMSESIRQQRVQMSSQTKLLMSSDEMKSSIQDANAKLRDEVCALEKRTEQLQQENLQLVKNLSAQEEELSVSSRQLDERAQDCQSLSRQLEAALADVKHQVEKVKEQAASREEDLRVRILEMEAQQSRQEKELRLLQQSKSTAEKRFQLQMKNMQLSLERSESHKRSIQSFVDLLKNSFHNVSAEQT